MAALCGCAAHCPLPALCLPSGLTELVLLVAPPVSRPALRPRPAPTPRAAAPSAGRLHTSLSHGCRSLHPRWRTQAAASQRALTATCLFGGHQMDGWSQLLVPRESTASEPPLPTHTPPQLEYAACFAHRVPGRTAPISPYAALASSRAWWGRLWLPAQASAARLPAWPSGALAGCLPPRRLPPGPQLPSALAVMPDASCLANWLPPLTQRPGGQAAGRNPLPLGPSAPIPRAHGVLCSQIGLCRPSRRAHRRPTHRPANARTAACGGLLRWPAGATAGARARELPPLRPCRTAQTHDGPAPCLRPPFPRRPAPQNSACPAAFHALICPHAWLGHHVEPGPHSRPPPTPQKLCRASANAGWGRALATPPGAAPAPAGTWRLPTRQPCARGAAPAQTHSRPHACSASSLLDALRSCARVEPCSVRPPSRGAAALSTRALPLPGSARSRPGGAPLVCPRPSAFPPPPPTAYPQRLRRPGLPSIQEPRPFGRYCQHAPCLLTRGRAHTPTLGTAPEHAACRASQAHARTLSPPPRCLAPIPHRPRAPAAHSRAAPRRAPHTRPSRVQHGDSLPPFPPHSHEAPVCAVTQSTRLWRVRQGVSARLARVRVSGGGLPALGVCGRRAFAQDVGLGGAGAGTGGPLRLPRSICAPCRAWRLPLHARPPRHAHAWAARRARMGVPRPPRAPLARSQLVVDAAHAHAARARLVRPLGRCDGVPVAAVPLCEHLGQQCLLLYVPRARLGERVLKPAAHLGR